MADQYTPELFAELIKQIEQFAPGGTKANSTPPASQPKPKPVALRT